MKALHLIGSNVPIFYDSWRENNKIIIKMEYCHSNLAEAMKLRGKFNNKYGELEILQIILDVVQTLNALHSMNFAHVDIKPGTLS